MSFFINMKEQPSETVSSLSGKNKNQYFPRVLLRNVDEALAIFDFL